MKNRAVGAALVAALGQLQSAADAGDKQGQPQGLPLRGSFAQLPGQIIRQAKLFDQAQLGFEVVHVAFFVA